MALPFGGAMLWTQVAWEKGGDAPFTSGSAVMGGSPKLEMLSMPPFCSPATLFCLAESPALGV